jgi:hypothetical protein
MLAVAAAALLAAPLSAFAFIPVGGKVVAVSPCPHLAGYLVTVAGFGIGTGVFWYLPGATLTYLYGPPVIGEWILGLSPAMGCTAPMLMTGTSPL